MSVEHGASAPTEATKVVIPPNAKKPQDHKKSKAQLEAEAASISVEYAGDTYTFERDAFDDVDLLELISDMMDNSVKLPQVMRTILGPDQWAKFKNTNRNVKGRVPLEHLRDLFGLIDEAAGKSSASPTS
jgi:hypothetical protein